LATLDHSQPTVVLCAGGARSAIASSVLLASGFRDVSDVLGGVNALGDGDGDRTANST
jgi:rhodanese-related sulfurtransferase